MVEVHHVEPDAVGYLSPAITLLREACAEVEVDFFVVGAAARDLLLEHVHGVKPFRSTGDLDIAVAVNGWDEYAGLVTTLKTRHHFADDREEQRLRRGALLVDVIPFGDIAYDGREIEWPVSNRTMSVLGYREAFDTAVGIQIGDEPPVRVASLPGVVVLKLVAWSEAPHRRLNDPIDICIVMMGYGEVAGDGLFVEHYDLLEGREEMRVTYARILGRDVAALLVDPDLRGLVLDLLRSNTEDDYKSRFVEAMGRECHSDFAFRLQCFRALRQGVEERLPDL